MKRASTMLVLATVAMSSIAIADEAKMKCDMCGMHVDTGHRVHYKLEVEGKKTLHTGSLTCAQKAWAQNKDSKIKFLGQDFVTGKWSDADGGHYLLGSSLKVGTGMDKGGAVIFFADHAMANKARLANGGKVMSLQDALRAVSK